MNFSGSINFICPKLTKLQQFYKKYRKLKNFVFPIPIFEKSDTDPLKTFLLLFMQVLFYFTPPSVQILRRTDKLIGLVSVIMLKFTPLSFD